MTSPPSSMPNSETIVSIAVLSVLAIIAAGVMVAQYRFNPAVALLDAHPQVSNGNAAPADSHPESLVGETDAIVALTPSERFDRRTLSDKINGKAELYLPAGFRQLTSQRFSLADRPDAWFEMFIYDMGNPDNAFAVYSLQQRDDAEPLALGSNAYRTPNALFWVHGRFYGEVIASATSSSLLTAMQKASQAFMRQNAVKSERFDPTSLFPQTGFIPDSVSLIPTDAFGMVGMDQVYTAEYRINDQELTAFVSRRTDPQAAHQLMQAYLDFLTRFGGQSLTLQPADPDLHAISLMDAHEIVFSSGSFVAGVHDAVDLQKAVNLALDMKKHLDEL